MYQNRRSVGVASHIPGPSYSWSGEPYFKTVLLLRLRIIKQDRPSVGVGEDYLTLHITCS